MSRAVPPLPTAHPAIRSLRDIEALEQVALEERIFSWDLNDWIRRGWSRDRARAAIHFLQHADPDETPFTVTHGELARRSTQAANLFRSLGVGAQDAVLILAPTIPELFYAQFGAISSGIACCVNWMLKPAHIAELAHAAQAKVIVALGPTPGHDIWQNVESIRGELAGVHILSVEEFDERARSQPADQLVFERRCAPDDTAAYVHSGGTTGAPKLVRLTHRNFAFKCWANAVVGGLTPDDCVFAINPPFHIAGFFGRGVLPVAWGMTMVSPSPLGAREKSFIANHWKLVERYRVTHFGGVPTTLAMLSKNPPRGEDVSSLKKHGSAGSSALPVEIAREFERVVGIRTLLTYGATEYTQNVCQAPRDGEPRYGSVGIRFPYTQVRTVKLDRSGEIERDCAPGEAGIVVVRGPSVTPGYVDPAQTRAAFTSDGFYKSGDVGRLDEEGYLWITGRVKDLIIRSGHNIEPSLIEDVLLQHPDVLLAAAVAKPDAYAGELPVAYVQLVEGSKVTGEALAAFALERIAERPAAPKEVIVLPRMPLTDVDKPAKSELRLDAAKRAFAGVLGEALSAPVEVAAMAEGDGSILVRIAASREHAGRIGQVMKAYSVRYELTELTARPDQVSRVRDR